MIMRKLIYILFVVSTMAGLTSCFEKLDNWYSATKDYDGRFVVSKTCDSDTTYNQTTLDAREELMLYNSAANTADEIILDVHVAGLPIKGKFKVTGTPADFKAGAEVVNVSSEKDITDNDMFLVDSDGDPVAYTSDLGVPESSGDEYPAIQFYTRLSLQQANISALGATTPGGNKSDSVYVKIFLYSDFLIIESYETPASGWAVPNEPEYAWRIKAGSRQNADGKEEEWTLEGYRYTGYPEDINPQVPQVQN
jgi:hypothetical protein